VSNGSAGDSSIPPWYDGMRAQRNADQILDSRSTNPVYEGDRLTHTESVSFIDSNFAQIAESAFPVTTYTLAIYTLYPSGRAALSRVYPLPSVSARNQGLDPWNDPQSCTQAMLSFFPNACFVVQKITLSSCIRSNRWSNQARQGPKSLKRRFPYAND
jgi:hypothetical protein